MNTPPDSNAAEMFARLASALETDWRTVARPNQLPPDWEWRFWLVLAGRGWGKTRSGAEWVRSLVENNRAKRIALVAPTAADVRDVIVEGQSGILAISSSWCRPTYEPSRRRLTWPNGAIATTYSADEPERLRGPQHDAAYCDEVGAWRYPEAWDQLMFGLRLGKNPRCVVTTTPRPIKLIKDLLAREGKDVAVTRGSTYENRNNLAPVFLEQIVRRYEGTRLGRQELNAEVLDDVPGALWDRARIDAARVEHQPALRRIVVAIDPAVTSGEDADETGIVVAGTGEDGHGYVLEDLSGRYAPIEWARIAVAAYRRHRADRIIAETNNGGEMVEATVRMVDPNVSFKAVHASRGKFTRAEPVSALYEQTRVHHVGMLPGLEDQMCSFTPDFDRERAKSSPDRVDALVWAFTELMVEGMAQAWIDHYGALASAAHGPVSPPDPSDPLPWRPNRPPSRPVVDNELIDIYRTTYDATVNGVGTGLRCFFCGEPMIPGGTRITDGIDAWHPGCTG
jgi:predicted phage terminase large subunit-like protein